MNPPYFDGLFRRLATGDSMATAAFGRHVHWGYWPHPAGAVCDAQAYGAAAEALSRLVCDTAEIRDGMRVLDVGCGFGGTLASLNERFTGLHLVGVNIDARQLERAANLVKPRAGNSVEFLRADASKIPLESERFDVVLAVECVFHFNRRGFFEQASCLLRQGGNLSLTDFVPSERATEYLDKTDFSADESVRWSYGDIDLTCSLSRYRKLAELTQLELSTHVDLTANTMPTYDFLVANAAQWPNRQEAALFVRATKMLQKASRKGMLGYQLLRFVKT